VHVVTFLEPPMLDPTDLPEPRALLDLDATFLPIGQMRQVSRLTVLTDEVIVGEVDLGAEHWVYPQHFPGDPIFPGTLMIEAAGQLVAVWAWAHGQRGRPRLVRTSAEFHSPVQRSAPRLLLRGEVRSKRHLHFGTVSLSVDSLAVATITALLAVLPADDSGRC
jgi:3-hydroxymyristoyl/3-hydroxydecanoyl-(acyl carrier protein) dehydratase